MHGLEYNRYCAFWRDYSPIAEFVPIPVALITPLPVSPRPEFVPIPVKLIRWGWESPKHWLNNAVVKIPLWRETGGSNSSNYVSLVEL